MADISVNPLYLKDAVITVDGDTYEKAVSSVKFTPSTTTATYKGLTPEAVYTESGSATWVVDIAYVQDWDGADSFSAYLFNNEGSQVTMTFKPQALSGGTFSATVIIAPGSVGGAVDSFGTSTVSLGVQGKPTYTPAV